jgi:hypothetical protein
MDYFYMITVKVEKYPLPMVPVMSVEDYGKLFNLLWELTDGQIRIRDGGLLIEDLGS